MSWGNFSPGCCCGSLCRYSTYIQSDNWAEGFPTQGYSLEQESNYYYSLNLQKHETVFNPHTGLTSTYDALGNVVFPKWKRITNPANPFQKIGVYGEFEEDKYEFVGKPWNIGLIILDGYVICGWVPLYFGHTELVNFLNRGKNIMMTAEHSSCITSSYRGVSNLATVRNNLAALGSTMDINPTLVNYGCQNVTNYAEPLKINQGIIKFPIGGSATINGGTPIVKALHDFNPIPNTVVAGEVVNGNNGKVFLLADANMLDCPDGGGLRTLKANICKQSGKPLT